MNQESLKEIFPFITEDHYNRLKILVNIFKEKNTHINLSSIRETEGIWNKHIIDSLYSVDIIKKFNPKRIVDMGTGGGFPTLPLAILFPKINFYAIDSVLKKLKCVDDFSKELNLNNVFTLNGRAEVLAHKKKYRAKFDMIITRAFAKFSPMIEMTLPFIKEQGYLLSYRGPDNDVEKDDKVLDYFGGFCEDIINYILPNDEKREIWVIKKVEPFLSHYPRKTGTPKKDPIVLE